MNHHCIITSDWFSLSNNTKILVPIESNFPTNSDLKQFADYGISGVNNSVLATFLSHKKSCVR